MADGFRYEASFDGVRIDVLSTNSNHGRRVFPHEFPKKSGATTEDQGREPLNVSISFIFIDRKAREGESLPIGDYQERFEAFQDLLLVDAVRTLVHPYLGQIRCRIRNFSTDGDGEGQPVIRCTADFIEENTEPVILDILDGAIQATAGAQAVQEAQASADEALLASGLSSSLPLQGFELATSWAVSFGLTTREVQLQMAEFNARLNDELVGFELGGDADKTQVMKSYTLLQYRMRKAAESFSTTTPRVVEIVTTELVPLRMIAARFYGADEAERRFAELLELNPQIRTPACVPPKLTLKAYSRTVRPQEFRSA